MISRRRFCGSIGVSLIFPFAARADEKHARPDAEFLGRWDLTVKGLDSDFPSWLEIRRSGHSTLVGSFVGQFGSARPVGKIEFADGRMRFSIPPQWEHRQDDLIVEGKLDGE